MENNTEQKKEYSTPAMKVVVLQNQVNLLADSSCNEFPCLYEQ